MQVISATELRGNMKKYLDIAATEKVLIQRGRNETFVLVKKDRLITDTDLSTALTGDELKKRMHQYIDTLFGK
jgi:hypothetical protein